MNAQGSVSGRPAVSKAAHGGSNPSPCATDCELVARALAGDRSAYDALCARHRDSVTESARRILQDEDDAQDVAQDVLVNAFQRLETLPEPARFGAWLRKATVHAAVSHLRERQRWVSLDDPRARHFLEDSALA